MNFLLKASLCTLFVGILWVGWGALRSLQPLPEGSPGSEEPGPAALTKGDAIHGKLSSTNVTAIAAGRSPALQAVPIRRKPATTDASSFLSESGSSWTIKRNSDGFVSKLSGGSFSVGIRAPIAASERLLSLYGEELLGAGLASLTQTDLRQEATTVQVIYEQRLHSLPVFGSRLSLFFDREGALVHLSAALFTGTVPSPPRPIVPMDAAVIARQLFLRYVGSLGEGEEVSSESYSTDYFLSKGQLGYRYGQGVPALVYRYQISATESAIGDTEVIIDATTANPVLVKSLNKK